MRLSSNGILFYITILTETDRKSHRCQSEAARLTPDAADDMVLNSTCLMTSGSM